MKNVIIVLFTLMISAPGLVAQDIVDVKDGQNIEKVATVVVDALDQQVSLDEMQSVDVHEVLVAGYEEMNVIRSNYKSTLQPMKDDLKELRKTYGKVNAENKDEVTAEVKRIRMKYKPELDAMQYEIRTVRSLAKEEIRSILTTDQIKKLDRVNDNRKQQFRKRLAEKRKKRIKEPARR